MSVKIFQDRGYQRRYKNKLRAGFKSHKRQVMCAPTGAGKTRMFSDMAFSSLQKSKKVAIVTDRIELCKQSYESVSHHTGDFEILKSGRFLGENHRGVIAMVETLNNRINAGWKWRPDLLIIDEAHKRNFNKIIDHWSHAYTIGATATPIGDHFHKYYTNIVNETDIPELIKLGFLARCRAYQMQDDLSDLKVSHGEFTEKSQYSHFNKSNLYSGVVEKWKEKAYGLKTLVFCVNVAHAENTALEFSREGVRTRCLTSGTHPNERDQILSDYSAGKFEVLVNCGILTTGFDEPDIRCIIVNRATNSLSLWLQMNGRGSRIADGKEEFIVLDFGMNHDRHGLWNAERKWEISPPRKKQAGAAAVKNCPKCEVMLYASARKCIFCGYEYPLIDKELKYGTLVEINENKDVTGLNKNISDLTLEELYKLQLSKRLNTHLVWRVVRSRGPEEVFKFSVMAGYKSGWVRRQEKMLDDSGFRDIFLI